MNSFLQKIDISFIAFVLIFHLFLGLIIANTGFIFGFSLQAFYYPLSLLITLIVFRNNTLTLFTVFVILMFCYIMSLIVFDNSYDGQYYHQETMIQLKNGWNPIYTSSNARIGKLWIDNYPKGGETLSSLIYLSANQIEIGKCINWIALFASFFICYCALGLLGLKKKLKILYSFLVAFNPVVVSQVFTYYIDALIYSFLVCCMCSVFLYLKQRKNIYLFIFVASMVLGSSIKFTSIVIFGVFISVSLLIILLVIKQKKCFFELLYSAGVGLLCLLTVTINPYLNNLLSGRHLFYPLLGKGAVDIMYLTTPRDFVDNHNRLEKLAITLFAKTGSLNTEKLEYKIPFSIHKDEIIRLADSDIMIGGFGVFYGGFLLLLFLFYLFNLKKLKNLKAVQKILLMSIIPLLISVIVISDPWWVRYIPHFYLIPILLLLILDINHNKIRYLPVLYIILIVNVSLFVGAVAIANFYKSQKIYYTLESLKKSNNTILIDAKEFKSTLNRLDEYDIPYREMQISPNCKKVIKFQPKGAVIMDENFIEMKKNKVFEIIQNNLYKDDVQK